MRKIYSDFREVVNVRKDYFDIVFKFPDNLEWVYPVFTSDEIRRQFMADFRKRKRYTQFADKYINKMWLSRDNWKIAYDVWQSRGKEYNKFNIQAYHRLLASVIPYLEREFEKHGKVRCDNFIFECLDLGFGTHATRAVDNRCCEFAMAVVYDTQVYVRSFG